MKKTAVIEKCILCLVLCIFILFLINPLPLHAEGEGTVSLPLDQYESLRKQAQKPASHYVPPPVDFYIPRSDYTLRCGEYSSLLTVRTDIVVMRSGLLQVPFMDMELPLRSSTLDGSPAEPMFYGGKYMLNLRGPGRHHVEMEIPFESILSSRSLSFTLIPSTIPTLTVESSLKNMEIRVNPGTPLQQNETGKILFKQYIMPHEGMVQVTAFPRQKIAKLQQKWMPKINADFQHHITLGEAMLSCETRANLQILNSPVREVSFLVPEGFSVVSVEGEHLAEHFKEGSTLTLAFDAPLEGTHVFVVKTEKKFRNVSDTTTFMPIKVKNGKNQKGYIGLSPKTNIGIYVTRRVRASQVDVSDMPSEIVASSKYPIIQAYKYLTPDCELDVQVKRYEDIPVLTAAIDRAVIMSRKTEEGLIVSKAVYKVRNNMKQHLLVTLPPKSEMWSAFVDGQAVNPGKNDRGSILVPLVKSGVNEGCLSAFSVELVYVTRGSRIGPVGMPEFPTPRVDLPISSLQFQVLIPEKAFVLRTVGMTRTDAHVNFQEFLSYIPTPSSFMRARSQGPLTACKSNMKNIGTALEMYNVDTVTGAPLQAGILPVRVDIPESGRSFAFERFMVTSASPAVRIFYVSRSFSCLMIAIISFLFLTGAFSLVSGTQLLPAAMRLFRPSEYTGGSPVITPHGVALIVLTGGLALLNPVMLAYPAIAMVMGALGGRIRKSALKKALKKEEQSAGKNEAAPAAAPADTADKKDYGSGKLAEQGA